MNLQGKTLDHMMRSCGVSFYGVLGGESLHFVCKFCGYLSGEALSFLLYNNNIVGT